MSKKQVCEKRKDIRRIARIKRSSRFIGGIALLGALSLSLAGCHGQQERVSFHVPDTFDESRQFDLTFWAKNDTNKTQTAIYEKAIADFEKQYPNITVNMRLYTDYGKIYNDVITNISTDTTPNVCITYPDHIATYLTGADVVVPLDELLTDASYGLGGTEVKFDAPTVQEVIPQYLKECSIGEHTYALPFMRSTEACYVNQDLVEKLGYTLPEKLTWDFVWEVSEAAMEKDEDGNFKVNGQKVMIPFIYKSTDNMMIQMLRQKNAGYSDNAGNVYLFQEDTKEILKTVAAHAGSGAFSTFKISSYPGNFLNAGQCIFAVDSTAGASWMGAKAPHLDIAEDKIVDYNIRVMEIPQFDTAAPVMISQGPSVCVFNKKDPQEVLASWLFMQYLLTNEVQTAYSETEGYVPVTMKARESEAYREYLAREGEDAEEHYFVKIQAAKLLLTHTEDTFTTPVFNGSASLRDAAGALIESTTKSMRRKEKVDDAYFEKLFKDTAALYHLDQSGKNTATGGDLGPLPAGSKALLVILVLTWILLGTIQVRKMLRKKD